LKKITWFMAISLLLLVPIWRWQPEAATSSIHLYISPTGTTEYKKIEFSTEEAIVVSTEIGLETIPLEEYLFYCVAAEMPASYPDQALCAQAICARTLAVDKLKKEDSHNNGADVCSSSSHCQAMIRESELKVRWGERFEEYKEKIQSCIEATKGYILCYQGEPIEIFYHASSNGATENVAEVFAADASYLCSVQSPEEIDISEAVFTLSECAALLKKKTGHDFSVSDLRSMKADAYTETGRVRSLVIGSYQVDAIVFRHALSLKSTDFRWEFEGDRIRFECKGYGHGVGMSQKGARTMAQSGSDYHSILTHYYPGCEILRWE